MRLVGETPGIHTYTPWPATDLHSQTSVAGSGLGTTASSLGTAVCSGAEEKGRGVQHWLRGDAGSIQTEVGACAPGAGGRGMTLQGCL